MKNQQIIWFSFFLVLVLILAVGNMKVVNIGMDVGSTTVKVVAMDNKHNLLYSDYRRHFSNTKKTIGELFDEITNRFPNSKYTLNMTGSGAIALAKFLDVNFVQEVIACKMRFVSMLLRLMYV